MTFQSKYGSNDRIFSNAVTHPNFVGYLPHTLESLELNYSPESLDTLEPAPLARYQSPQHYVVGYSDPGFSGGEYTIGLSYLDSVARKVLLQSKHDDLPLLAPRKSECTEINDSPTTITHIHDNSNPLGNIGKLQNLNELSNRDRLISMSVNSVNGATPYLSNNTSVPFEYVPLNPSIKDVEPRSQGFNANQKPVWSKEKFNVVMKNNRPTLEMTDNDFITIADSLGGKGTGKAMLKKIDGNEINAKYLNLNKRINVHYVDDEDDNTVYPTSNLDDNKKLLSVVGGGDASGVASNIANVYANNMSKQPMRSTYADNTVSNTADKYANNTDDNTVSNTDDRYATTTPLTTQVDQQLKSYVHIPAKYQETSRVNHPRYQSAVNNNIINSPVNKYSFGEDVDNVHQIKTFIREDNSTADKNNKLVFGNQNMSNDIDTYKDYINYKKFVNAMKQEDSKETFDASNQYDPRNLPEFDNTFEFEEISSQYLNALKTRAMAVCFYLRNNNNYKHWAENWKFLQQNLDKSKLLFEKLKQSDLDIAYVVNKGDEINFRIRDTKRYVPLNVYQYVLYHEMAHMSTHELQHTPKFKQLLSIISLAAFELGFIDLPRIPCAYYTTNGQPILCRGSLIEEISEGCMLVGRYAKNKKYYDDLCVHVNNLKCSLLGD